MQYLGQPVLCVITGCQRVAHELRSCIKSSSNNMLQIPKDSTLLAVASVIILLDFLLYIVLLVLNQITTSTSPQPNLEKGPMRNVCKLLGYEYFAPSPLNTLLYRIREFFSSSTLSIVQRQCTIMYT